MTEIMEKCAELGRELRRIGYDDRAVLAVDVMSGLAGVNLLQRTRNREVVYARYIVAHLLRKEGMPMDRVTSALRIDRCTVIHGVQQIDTILKSKLVMDIPMQNLYQSFKAIMTNEN